MDELAVCPVCNGLLEGGVCASADTHPAPAELYEAAVKNLIAGWIRK